MVEIGTSKRCLDEEKTARTCIVCYGRQAGDGSSLSLWKAIERELNQGGAINVHDEPRSCLKLLVPCLLTAVKRLYRKHTVIGNLNADVSGLEKVIAKHDNWKPPTNVLTYVLMTVKLSQDVEKHASRVDELAQENLALKRQLKEQSDYIRSQVGLSKNGPSECKLVDKKALTDLLVEYGNERATLRLLKASFIDEPGDMMCDLSVGAEGDYMEHVQKLKDLKAKFAKIDVPVDVVEGFKKMLHYQREECEATIEGLKKKRPRYDLL